MHDSQPIGYTSCEGCRGSGKKEDGTSCTGCKGTGLVAVFIQPGWLENRRYPRYPTDLALRVRDQEVRDLDGRCFVIAEGGLSGDLPEPIPVGNLVQLRLVLPTHPKLLEVWAVVRYRQGLQHGFEFVSLTNAERLSIVEFCNGLAIQPSTGQG